MPSQKTVKNAAENLIWRNEDCNECLGFEKGIKKQASEVWCQV